MKKGLSVLFVLLLGVSLLAATYSDAFTRADSGTLGADWTDAGAGMQIVSNTARGDTTTADYDIAWYDAGAFANDHYSEATLGNVATMTDFAFLVVRAVGTDAASLRGYAMALYKPTPQIILYSMDAGEAFTQLEVWEASSTFTDGDVYKISVVGTTLRGYRNSVELTNSPFTSSTYSSGAAGLGANDNLVSWDNWTGADIGGAAAPRGLLLGVGP